MRSGTDLSQFLRILLPTLAVALITTPVGIPMIRYAKVFIISHQPPSLPSALVERLSLLQR